MKLDGKKKHGSGRNPNNNIVAGAETGKGKADGVTLAEIAKISGAAHSTVAAYAQKAGWTENGKRTLLNEKQATIIVEAMKARETGGAFHKRENGDTFHNVVEGIETSGSRAVRIAVLAKKQHEIDLQIQAELNAEIADLKAENTRLEAAYGREVLDRKADKALLSERETVPGVNTYRKHKPVDAARRT